MYLGSQAELGLHTLGLGGPPSGHPTQGVWSLKPAWLPSYAWSKVEVKLGVSQEVSRVGAPDSGVSEGLLVGPPHREYAALGWLDSGVMSDQSSTGSVLLGKKAKLGLKNPA